MVTLNTLSLSARPPHTCSRSFLFGYEPARMAHEVREGFERLGVDLDRPARLAQLEGGLVEHEVLEREQHLPRLARGSRHQGGLFGSISDAERILG